MSCHMTATVVSNGLREFAAVLVLLGVAGCLPNFECAVADTIPGNVQPAPV